MTANSSATVPDAARRVSTQPSESTPAVDKRDERSTPTESISPKNWKSIAAAMKARSVELDRRESVLNERIASFETLFRRRASDAARQADRTRNEIESNAEQDRREAEIAQKEAALSRREAEIDAREAEIVRRDEENAEVARRLVALKESLGARERELNDRSSRAIESIRRQKAILVRLRRELEEDAESSAASPTVPFCETAKVA